MLRFDVVSPLPTGLSPRLVEIVASTLTKSLHLRSNHLISLRFVSLTIMQDLNLQHRRKDKPTDVLSFATSEEMRALTPLKTAVEAGDVIICPAYARAEAKRRGMEVQEELVRLIVHGVMHIYGYDHVSEQEEADMFRLQEKVVEMSLYSA